MFRPSREQRGEDRFLSAKIVLLVVGAGFGLAGMLSERGWMVYVGIGIIAVGLLLRLISARTRE